MLSVDHLVIYEAKRWLNVVERGGNNRGEIVQMFQRAADNRAHGEPWCAAFIQYVVKHVLGLLLDQGYQVVQALPITEHCMTMWRMAPMGYKSAEPHLGDVVVWQKGTSTSGHCGVVVGIGTHYIYTIEGNTGSGDQRDGDGVYFKKRPRGGFGKFKEVGFIQPITARVLN